MTSPRQPISLWQEQQLLAVRSTSLVRTGSLYLWPLTELLPLRRMVCQSLQAIKWNQAGNNPEIRSQENIDRTETSIYNTLIGSQSFISEKSERLLKKESYLLCPRKWRAKITPSGKWYLGRVLLSKDFCNFRHPAPNRGQSVVVVSQGYCVETVLFTARLSFNISIDLPDDILSA